MKIRRLVLGLSLALALGTLAGALLAPHPAAAKVHRGRAKRHVLVVTVTKGFRHGSIPVAEETIQKLGDETKDWDTDFVRTDDDMKAKMTPEALKGYDAVIFANTTGVLPLPDPQGFLDYIKAGHGFAAMHSGSDTFHEWPGQSGGVSAYVEMLGGEFLTHHGQCAVDAHIVDPNNPATRPLVNLGLSADKAAQQTDLQKGSRVVGGVWQIFDEIYLFKNNDRTKVHVLLAMDHYPNDGSPEANQPGEHLLSWCKSYGKGRVFYTELGHRDETWHDPIYQQHVLGGIRFALGLAKANTKPSPPLMASK
jgi:type 1 glutamine amidotransferase